MSLHLMIHSEPRPPCKFWWAFIMGVYGNTCFVTNALKILHGKFFRIVRTHIQYEPVTSEQLFFVFFYFLQDSKQHFPIRYKTGAPVGSGICRLNSHFRQASDEPNRPRFVLVWTTTRKDRAPHTCVRLAV
jgi:hypothetical protein